jgi:metal transporter CNNM
VWLVQIFKYLLLIITWPLAKLLDKVLGAEMGTVHSSSEMTVLFEKYVEQGNMGNEQAEMMTGALTYKDKTAIAVMTPTDLMFTLSINDKLDFRALSNIFKSGFSRIPVLGRDKNHVVGMILTKDLILIDPEEEHTVKAAMQLFGRTVHQIFPDMKLPDVLQEFKSGRGHLAVVMDVNNEGDGDPVYEVIGLVTLEDIIEEILHTEIVDETDNYIHMEAGDKVSRDSFDVARLRILDSHNQSTSLGPDEARAVAAHLIANVGAFRDAYVNSGTESKTAGGKLSSAAVMDILSNCQVLELKESEWLMSIDEEEESDALNTPEHQRKRKKPLYSRERVATFFTLVLSGKVEILSGRDEVRVEYGAFQHLGEGCLKVKEGTWKPDFSAFVIGDDARCLRVPCSLFFAAINPAQVAVKTTE